MKSFRASIQRALTAPCNLDLQPFLKEVRPRRTKAKRDTEKPKRKVRFPGLMTAAHELGVHRNHLYLVLTGQRTSHSLAARYTQWKNRGARRVVSSSGHVAGFIR